MGISYEEPIWNPHISRAESWEQKKNHRDESGEEEEARSDEDGLGSSMEIS